MHTLRRLIQLTTVLTLLIPEVAPWERESQSNWLNDIFSIWNAIHKPLCRHRTLWKSTFSNSLKHFLMHTTLLRRWINVNDVDSASQQRRVPSGIYLYYNIALQYWNKGFLLKTIQSHTAIYTENMKKSLQWNVIFKNIKCGSCWFFKQWRERYPMHGEHFLWCLNIRQNVDWDDQYRKWGFQDCLLYNTKFFFVLGSSGVMGFLGNDGSFVKFRNHRGMP